MPASAQSSAKWQNADTINSHWEQLTVLGVESEPKQMSLQYFNMIQAKSWPLCSFWFLLMLVTATQTDDTNTMCWTGRVQSWHYWEIWRRLVVSSDLVMPFSTLTNMFFHQGCTIHFLVMPENSNTTWKLVSFSFSHDFPNWLQS